jgi:hypothetical protein
VEYEWIDYEVKYVNGEEISTEVAHWGDLLTEPEHEVR